MKCVNARTCVGDVRMTVCKSSGIVARRTARETRQSASAVLYGFLALRTWHWDSDGVLSDSGKRGVLA